MLQLLQPYTTTRKTVASTIRTIVSRVLSLLFNTLSGFVIAFMPKSKRPSWLQSPSAVILEPTRRKSTTTSVFVLLVTSSKYPGQPSGWNWWSEWWLWWGLLSKHSTFWVHLRCPWVPKQSRGFGFDGRTNPSSPSVKPGDLEQYASSLSSLFPQLRNCKGGTYPSRIFMRKSEIVSEKLLCNL